MSALRNYRRSLSERRESLSEMYQQDAKRTVSESSTNNYQATTSAAATARKYDSSSEDEEVQDFSRRKDGKTKEGRRLSLDFLFFRNKNKPEEKKKKQRSQSTSGPSPGEMLPFGRQRKMGIGSSEV